MSTSKHEVITLCGSRRFFDTIMKEYNRLQKEFKIVFTPNFSFNKEDIEKFTDEEIQYLHDVHDKKIDMSDIVYVIDVGGYIGDDTRREVEYAKAKGKIIHFYSTAFYS